MVTKQVSTMVTSEKIASGGDWYISLWTADEKEWVQKNRGQRQFVCCKIMKVPILRKRRFTFIH